MPESNRHGQERTHRNLFAGIRWPTERAGHAVKRVPVQVPLGILFRFKHLFLSFDRNRTGKLIFEVWWLPGILLNGLVVKAGKPFLKFLTERVQLGPVGGSCERDASAETTVAPGSHT
jgi:hypothetical protein